MSIPLPLEERDHYREALERIRTEGKVCANYELCDHVACRSSYTAWAIADEALASAASGDPVARETTPPSPASEQGRRTP